MKYDLGGGLIEDRGGFYGSMMFRFMLFVSLKSVGAHGLPPGGEVRVGHLLQQFSNGKPLLQARLAGQHEHAWN